MGVTVQLMVDAAVSGVMFTCNPVSGDPSMVAVNASWGLGLAVVGGEVTPDEYLVSKVTREVVRQTISAKQRRVRAGRRRPRGRARWTCPTERRERCPASTSEQLADARRLARRVRAPLRLATRTSSGRSRAGGDAVRPAVAAGHGDGAKPAEAPERAASAISLVMSKFGAGDGLSDG